jgi:hypothetical protein
VYWRLLPGRSDEEKLCRQVIHWARLQLEDTMTTSQAHARLQALEAELSVHIARHGKTVDVISSCHSDLSGSVGQWE